MITANFSLTATERVLPKLALDFTTASLDSRVTFTRTTDATHPATYVDSSGYVVAATNNQPRFDYDPVTLACKGLLIEESRTNLLLRSDEFNVNTTWVPESVSVLANATVAPSGASTADEIKALAATNRHRLYVNPQIVTTNGIAYAQSWVAKAGTHNFVQLAVGNQSTDFVNFDLSTGTIGTYGGSITANISNVGNGWYRISMVYTSGGINRDPTFALVPSNSATRLQSWTATGTETVFLWGAQLEAGAFATSYISTTTAALTRNADVATITGTNFSGWWRAGPGSILVRALPSTVSGTRPLVQVDDNVHKTLH